MISCLKAIRIAAVFLIFLPQVVFAFENGGVDYGATAWMLTFTALVLLMVPGLAMFYGGLVRTKNVLGTMMHSFVAMAVIGVAAIPLPLEKIFSADGWGGTVTIFF